MRTFSVLPQPVRRATGAPAQLVEPLEQRMLLTADSWLVIARNENKLPDGLADQILAAGGTLTATMPEIGLALAESSSAGFAAAAAAIPGVAAVVPDIDFLNVGAIGMTTDAPASPPRSLVPDDYSGLQWALDAIDAPQAWATGARGAGVRVAVLDWGIDTDHVDLAPNLNMALSRSLVNYGNNPEGLEFVPGGAFPFSHGSAVSGIIAAADNGVGTIGVAPEAEIVHLKIGFDRTGSAPGGVAMSAIYLAANLGADVINMSFGGTFSRDGWYLGDPHNPNDDRYIGAEGVAWTVQAELRAMQYAYSKGVTLVAAAGNWGLNRDQTSNMLYLPADLPHVIQVSATGPRGWMANPQTNLDVPAEYTNYGLSAIDIAAPGGSYGRPYFWRMSDDPAPSWAYDLMLTPDYDDGWMWAGGTSFSTPHVVGAAALIIGANGGDMHPNQVRSVLLGTADDLGKPGKDEYYGHGRLNAYNAVARGTRVDAMGGMGTTSAGTAFNSGTTTIGIAAQIFETDFEIVTEI